MENRRLSRMEKELKVIIAEYLVGGFKGSLRGLVSVAEVAVSRDLKQAKVYVSVLGSEQDREANLTALDDQLPLIQRHLSQRLSAKFCPRLKFFINKASLFGAEGLPV